MGVNLPHSADHAAYECNSCGQRLESAEDSCESFLCEGRPHNVAVGRE